MPEADHVVSEDSPDITRLFEDSDEDKFSTCRQTHLNVLLPMSVGY